MDSLSIPYLSGPRCPFVSLVLFPLYFWRLPWLSTNECVSSAPQDVTALNWNGVVPISKVLGQDPTCTWSWPRPHLHMVLAETLLTLLRGGGHVCE